MGASTTGSWMDSWPILMVIFYATSEVAVFLSKDAILCKCYHTVDQGSKLSHTVT